MKNGIFGCLAALIWLMSQCPSDAVLIDVSQVSFTSFVPDPIEPGQRPTSYGYSFRYDKETNASVSAGFSFSISLSPNAAFGDGDDVLLGTHNAGSQTIGGIGGTITATTSNPNGLSFFQVPANLTPGEYNAFLFIAPRSPHFDHDSGDAIGQLPGTVTVGQPPPPDLDYNGDGTVNAADYTVWRDTLGATGAGLAADGNGNNVVDAGDYAVWQAGFGQSVGSASVSNAVPEPATLGLCIALAALLLAQRAAVSPGATADQPSSVKRIHASISGPQAMSVTSSRRLGANERENCTPQGVAATFFWTTYCCDPAGVVRGGCSLSGGALRNHRLMAVIPPG